MKKNNFQKNLSEREKEIIFLIANENTNREISRKLFLSEGTIASYRNGILSKIAAKNSAGIVRIAYEKGILVLDRNRKVQLSNKVHLSTFQGSLKDMKSVNLCA